MEKIIQITLAVLLLASCGKDSPEYPKEGDRLPVFTVTDSNGQTVTDKTLSAGKSLIVFFHTMCEDCRKELPSADSIFVNCGDGVKVIAISRAEGNESIEQFWKEKGLTMPYSPQKDRAIYDLFTDCGVPYLLIIAEGVIQKTYNAYRDGFVPTYRTLIENFN